MLDLLQSLLAFALTMLAIATIVTMIMETIARLFRRRDRLLRHLLTLVFEKEIKPLLSGRLATADITRAVAAIQTSPFVPKKNSTWLNRLTIVLNRLLGANQSNRLTSEEFLQRLSRTEVGTRIVEEFDGVESELEQSLARIKDRYEEISTASTEWMTNSSSVLSLALGVVLALAWNIDGSRILDSYIANPSKSAEVTAQADKYIEANEAAQRRLQEALDKIDSPVNAGGGSTAAQEALQDVRDRLEAIEKQGGMLLAEGLPIGLDFYPHCRLPVFDPRQDVDPRCMNAITWGDWAWILLVWLPVVVVTGILIGLGGPFWYDAVLGLMRVTQLLRGVTGSAKADSDREGAGGEAATDETMADLFRHRYAEIDDADPVPEHIRENLELRERQLDGLARRIRKRFKKSPPSYRRGRFMSALTMFTSVPDGAQKLLKQYEEVRKEWRQLKALEVEYGAAPSEQ